MNSTCGTQFGCYIYFIKKLASPVNSARDPGLDANASRVCYPNSHLIFVKSVGPTVFNLFTKMPLNNIVCILKTDMKSFLKSVFKYHILNNITQTLLKKTIYQTFFFFEQQFSVFEH